MWKKIVLTSLSLLLAYSNNIFANDTNNQYFYLNILDLDNSFEENLTIIYSEVKDDSSLISLTELPSNNYPFIKLYRITRENRPELVDMNTKEEYILRLFKSNTINNNDNEINIETTPIYSTWFTDFLAVKLQSSMVENTEKLGMLPFLNTKHIKIIPKEGESIEATTKINQLLEMAGAVSRQINVQRHLDNPNILGTFVVNDMELLETPDNSLLNTMKQQQPHYNINNLLSYMYDITQAVEFLHINNIAHGDIKLTNFFTLLDKTVLTNFERFSVLDDSISGLGRKNFTFYNNFYHAPEIRFPLGEDQKWSYTNITFEGDIYSLGMVFAGLLYLCHPEEFDVNRLTVANNVSIDAYSQAEQKKANLFNNQFSISNRHLEDETAVAMSIDENTSISNQLSQADLEILNELINVINACHQQNPENRPTATAVKDMLNKIIATNNNTKL
jgi:serine/threonine protein kinase